MQTLTLSSNLRHVPGQLPKSETPMRLRAFRFVSERFTQRERTGVVAEYFLFALITLTATWAVFSLIQALGLLR